MKKIIILKLFLLLIAFDSFAQASDTIAVSAQKEFDNIINASFEDYVGALNLNLRSQIDSIFRYYDFSSDEYNCQFEFSFYLELDSCGYIASCIPLDNDTITSVLIDFESKVISLLLNSNWQLRTIFSALSTSYKFDDAIVTFEVSCDPLEIIFREDNNLINEGTIFEFDSMQGKIYFSGFNLGCPPQSSP